jgi:hypothetical protein
MLSGVFYHNKKNFFLNEKQTVTPEAVSSEETAPRDRDRSEARE